VDPSVSGSGSGLKHLASASGWAAKTSSIAVATAGSRETVGGGPPPANAISSMALPSLKGSVWRPSIVASPVSPSLETATTSRTPLTAFP
jgi:hypothetical protein